MSIDDDIRRIAREEIERLFRERGHDVRLDTRPIVPRTVTVTLPATGVPEGRRIGCACPPETRDTCPSAVCPWRAA